MKYLVVALALVAVCVALPYPQKEGATYSAEAIRQAQQSSLIPKDAEILGVKESIPAGVFLNVQEGNIDVAQYFPDLPEEVVRQLNNQVRGVGSRA